MWVSRHYGRHGTGCDDRVDHGVRSVGKACFWTFGPDDYCIVYIILSSGNLYLQQDNKCMASIHFKRWWDVALSQTHFTMLTMD